jgi:hypothetical protein
MPTPSMIVNRVRINLRVKVREKAMLTQLMVKPSSWIEKGIKLSPVRENYLFKFTEELQCLNY